MYVSKVIFNLWPDTEMVRLREANMKPVPLYFSLSIFAENGQNYFYFFGKMVKIAKKIRKLVKIARNWLT
jgi:hypothetical protein